MKSFTFTAKLSHASFGFPNQIADPGWVHDDDGLSETGRMNFKMQFLMTIAAGVVLASNTVFK